MTILHGKDRLPKGKGMNTSELLAIAAFGGLLTSGVMAGTVGAAPPLAAPTIAAAPSNSAAAPEARIPFANKGGIWNWEIVDDKTLLIQDRSRKWYKATLLMSCSNLPFAETIGFESNANGSFDKFSSIQTRQQRCPLASLVATTAPPKKSKSAKQDAVHPAPPSPADANLKVLSGKP
jgi:Family of unknown function (DUF6491)